MTAKFTAAQICQACGGRLAAGQPQVGATAISTDSRTLTAGQAFLALAGPNHDGHSYVPQALQAGATVIVAERRDSGWCLPPGAALVLVAGTSRALLDLAAWHRRRLRGKVLAITGSCGKSTVKTMTAAILSRTGRCTSAPKSFNNRIGVSHTLLAAEAEDDFVVLEMGTSHHGEIDELARAARPHAGLITCIADCHLEGLGDRRGVMEAKGELVGHLEPGGLLALNADDPLCMELAGRHVGAVRTFGFSPGADVRPVGLRPEGEGQAFEICGRSFRLPVPGGHNVLNAAAAVCLSGWAGASLEQCCEALAQVALPDLRLQRRRIGDVEYLLDCYNSNPTAMRAALSTVLERYSGRRLMVVCGDMLELGSAAPHLHMHLGRVLALMRVDTLVAVGPLGRYLVRGWSQFAGEDQKAFHLSSADQAWPVVEQNVEAGDVVLIKGSRAMQLESIPEAIARRAASSQQEAVA